MGIIDGSGNAHLPAGSPGSAGGQFAGRTNSAPTGQIDSTIGASLSITAGEARRGDRIIAHGWDDDSDSELITEQVITKVDKRIRLEDRKTFVQFTFEDGTTSIPRPASAPLSVLPGSLHVAQARPAKDLLADLRAGLDRVRHGETLTSVEADDLVAAVEDPGSDGYCVAAARYIAVYLRENGNVELAHRFFAVAEAADERG